MRSQPVLSSLGGTLRQLDRRESFELELEGGKGPGVGNGGRAVVEAVSRPSELRFDFNRFNFKISFCQIEGSNCLKKDAKTDHFEILFYRAFIQ